MFAYNKQVVTHKEFVFLIRCRCVSFTPFLAAGTEWVECEWGAQSVGMKGVTCLLLQQNNKLNYIRVHGRTSYSSRSKSAVCLLLTCHRRRRRRCGDMVDVYLCTVFDMCDWYVSWQKGSECVCVVVCTCQFIGCNCIILSMPTRSECVFVWIGGLDACASAAMWTVLTPTTFHMSSCMCVCMESMGQSNEMMITAGDGWWVEGDYVTLAETQRMLRSSFRHLRSFIIQLRFSALGYPWCHTLSGNRHFNANSLYMNTSKIRAAINESAIQRMYNKLHWWRWKVCQNSLPLNPLNNVSLPPPTIRPDAFTLRNTLRRAQRSMHTGYVRLLLSAMHIPTRWQYTAYQPGCCPFVLLSS